MLKRISNRVYPPRICEQCGDEFIPIDNRQKFCFPQHRVDYNNDQRKLKTEPLLGLNKKLLENQSILNNIYNVWNKPFPAKVPFEFLELMGFHFDVNSTITRNTKSNNNVFWNLSFGIEKVEGERKEFIIYKNK